MRQQIDTSKKFLDKINEHLDGDEMKELSKRESRSALRSLAETLRIVASVQSDAAKFNHVAKPKETEEASGRISLFVSVSPLKPQEPLNVTGT
jgi:hypothetical protein